MWYTLDTMKLFKKWDFWYWLLLFSISLGSFFIYSEKDGSLGDAVLLMLIFVVLVQFVGIYLVAKLGQFLTRKILKNRHKL